jgi:hypothetical protein
MVLGALLVIATVAAARPAAADSTGVPACDAFLAVYEQCVRDRVPESERSEMLASIETTRATYRRLHTSTTLRVRPDLDAVCKETRARTAEFMARIYGCTFAP